MAISPDHTKLAYTVDFTGAELYQIIVLELATGKVLDDGTTKSDSGVTWGDDKTLFYTVKDDISRPYRVYRHVVGAKQDTDVLLLEDLDELFNVGIGKSRSGRFIYIEASSTETSELHFIDLHASKGAASPVTVVQPRQTGLRYDVDHDGTDGFLLWSV